MRNKRPINLTLHSDILKMADKLREALGYSSLSTFVEDLIREEYERRNGPILLTKKSKKSSSSVSVTATETSPEEHKARKKAAL